MVYEWQDTPLNEDLVQYMHKLRWSEELIEKTEWESGIPIWCGTCERVFNACSQWKDHVRGKLHAKYLLEFRGQDKPRHEQGFPNTRYANSKFKGSEAEKYVLATYLVELIRQLEKPVESTMQPTSEVSEDKTYFEESEDVFPPIAGWADASVSSSLQTPEGRPTLKDQKPQEVAETRYQ